MTLVHEILDALGMAGSKAWQIAWSLILGFALSAIVQAVVRREAIVRTLGDDRPAALVKATGLGIASPSCTYAGGDLVPAGIKASVPGVATGPGDR